MLFSKAPGLLEVIFIEKNRFFSRKFETFLRKNAKNPEKGLLYLMENADCLHVGSFFTDMKIAILSFSFKMTVTINFNFYERKTF